MKKYKQRVFLQYSTSFLTIVTSLFVSMNNGRNIETKMTGLFFILVGILYIITQTKYIDTAISLLSENKWTPENIKTMYRASLKVGGSRPATFIDRTSAQLRSGGMRLIKDKKVATLITEYWQLIAQYNEFETVAIHEYKLNVKNMTYKIFDGTNYLNAKNKIIKDGATLMTYDKNFLLEYNNRLLNLNYDLKAFINRFFYENIEKKIDELQKAISESYHIAIPATPNKY